MILPRLSVMFFGSADTGTGPGRYHEIIRIAELADGLGFEAVWVPERHYHQFGGLFPAPAVLAGALALRTRSIGLRAGSVVAPRHDPVTIAEDWALVDALSGGRAGLSLATGWNRGDFANARCSFEDRREYTFGAVNTLRRLWRGESVKAGDTEVPRIFPSPVQNEVPLWLTATSGPATFAEAGRRGCRVLTAYLQLDRPSLQRNVALYRQTLADSCPERAPHVTLMLHTCVAGTAAEALAAVESPLLQQQEQFLDLNDRAGDALTEDEKRDLARYAARKYARERGLVGGPAEVVERLRDLADIGIDEVACLVDFGITADQITETLTGLAAITR